MQLMSSSDVSNTKTYVTFLSQKHIFSVPSRTGSLYLLLDPGYSGFFIAHQGISPAGLFGQRVFNRFNRGAAIQYHSGYTGISPFKKVSAKSTVKISTCIVHISQCLLFHFPCCPGPGYLFFVILFFILAVLSLWLLYRMGIYRLTAKRLLGFTGILVVYFILIVALETIDVALFQHRFPHIEIGDGRVYHDPNRNYK